MDRWTGRVALVTGASSGIGAAICKALVKSGMKVVGAARRVDRIENLANELEGEKGSLIPVKCDVTEDEEVYAMFNTIKEKYGGVDICVNNAGMVFYKSLLDGSLQEWRAMTNLNIIALCLCTKLAVVSMKERGVDDGHIIQISSVSAHSVNKDSFLHFYSGTKHAVRALTEGLRQELREAKSHIRVSSVSPGLVETEILLKATNDPDFAKLFFAKEHVLQSEDIASTVLHIISSPSHVEINDVILSATGSTFA